MYVMIHVCHIKTYTRPNRRSVDTLKLCDWETRIYESCLLYMSHVSLERCSALTLCENACRPNAWLALGNCCVCMCLSVCVSVSLSLALSLCVHLITSLFLLQTKRLVGTRKLLCVYVSVCLCVCLSLSRFVSVRASNYISLSLADQTLGWH